MNELVIHGHFYQPPRENPWTGNLDRDPKVYPDHDWNERIHHECYRANAFCPHLRRVRPHRAHRQQLRGHQLQLRATLLSWLEHHDPNAYQRILDADRKSAATRNGHGNAIAQAYNHTICPRDAARRVTQIKWGLADFRRRFGREPESLWLPETACNDATLGALIDECVNSSSSRRTKPSGCARSEQRRGPTCPAARSIAASPIAICIATDPGGISPCSSTTARRRARSRSRERWCRARRT